MKRYLCFVLCVVMVLGVFSACGKNNSETEVQTDPINSTATEAVQQESSASQEQIKEGGRLKIGMEVPDQLLWLSIQGSPQAAFAALYIEPLMKWNEKGELCPWLLESITPDKDNLTWTMVTKENVYFSDGSLFDAECLAWNLNYYKENGGQAKTYFINFESAEAVDDRTVVCHFANWELMFPTFLTYSMNVVSKQAFDQYGVDYLAKNPIGTGPFVVTAWEPDTTLSLDKNANYWGGEPKLDGLDITYFPEDMVAEMALEQQEIDVFATDSYLVADEMAEAGSVVAYAKLPSMAYTLCFNSKNTDSPISDVRVRKAISYAIDTEALNNAVTNGHGILSNQWCLPGSTFYNDKVEGQAYDLQKAKELMKEAGYENGFTTKIYCNGTDMWKNTAVVIKEMLMQINIDAEVCVTENGTYANYINGWDEGMLVHTMGLEPGAACQYGSTFMHGIGFGLGTQVFDISDDLDELVRTGKTAASEAESVSYFKDAAQIIFDEDCLIKVLYCSSWSSVANDYVKDSGVYGIQNRRVDVVNTWLDK